MSRVISEEPWGGGRGGVGLFTRAPGEEGGE